MTPKTILITGATGGIGLALARLYHGRGAALHLLGRRPRDELGDEIFQRARYHRVDLARSGFEVELREELERRGVGGLDLLILNAGVGYFGAVEDQGAAAVGALLAVNVAAPLVLSHVLAGRLRAVGGKIVLIGSVLSALACPDAAVYGASKAALDGFARSLRAECDTRISIQVIHPGATRTGMQARSGMPRDRIHERRFSSAEQTARAIVRAIDGNRARVVLGAGNRALCWAGTWLGGPIDGFMAWRRRRCAT